MKFDISKCQKNEQGYYLCQTRDGRKARIVCVNKMGGNFPIVALVDTAIPEYEVVVCFLADGRVCLHGESCNDLINIPAEFEFEQWVNVYAEFNDSRNLCFHRTRQDADYAADYAAGGMGRIACVRVVIKGKEGDGL